MIKNTCTLLIGSFCFLLITNLFAQQSGTLTVTGENFSNSNGKAIANLFRKEDDVPKKYHRQVSAEIKNGKATLAFYDLPYGEYALIVFHDENGNAILDHKFGFPNEPMGFSNNWKLTLFSGMPGFEKLKFEFGVKTQGVTVRLK